jgi:DNA-binding MarR family transcriptional regulator
MEHQQDLQFVSDLRTVLGKVIKKLRKESPSAQKLSFTERSVMGQLYQCKALLPSELAAAEMITNQSMSQVLNRLSEFGYIVRSPSETDKRKVNISLSKDGETTLLRVRHERNEWLLKAIKASCTEEEQQQLKKVIGPLTKLAEFK